MKEHYRGYDITVSRGRPYSRFVIRRCIRGKDYVMRHRYSKREDLEITMAFAKNMIDEEFRYLEKYVAQIVLEKLAI